MRTIALGQVISEEDLDYIKHLEDKVYNSNFLKALNAKRVMQACPKRNYKLKPKNFSLDKYGLTTKERNFVRAYCSEGAPTYKHARLSAYKSHNPSSDGSADKAANVIMKRGRVRVALQNFLRDYDDEIQEKIVDGIRERLKDPKKAAWLPTADFYAKIKGEYAPDKQVQISLSSEDRDARYEETKRKILEAKRQAELNSKKQEIMLEPTKDEIKYEES